MCPIFMYQFTLQSALTPTISLGVCIYAINWSGRYLIILSLLQLGKWRPGSLCWQRLNWSLRFPCIFTPTEKNRGTANDQSYLIVPYSEIQGINWGKRGRYSYRKRDKRKRREREKRPKEW